MAKKKKKKLRVAIHKNVQKRKRRGAWREELKVDETGEMLTQQERISGKGKLSRKRTVIASEESAPETSLPHLSQPPPLAVDESQCLRGRVISVYGAECEVESEDHKSYKCVIRGLLRRIARESRTAVTVGDRVLFSITGEDEGRIERVDPRHGSLARKYRGREHLMVTNVDQLLLVVSVAQPYLKIQLIDRFLASAEQGELPARICLNKTDLVDPESLAPVDDLYRQLGYDVIMTSALTGEGIEILRQSLKERATVLSGQSGVGKSSLLNALQPGLELRVRSVAEDNQKGRHTTTTARLIRMDFGGWVVDTPGIRQFALWDVIPEELEAFFIEFPTYVENCKYPACSHTHESHCAVKEAVENGHISPSRYESYWSIFHEDPIE